MRIGNDIVDLQMPEARDKFLDQRFVERAFTSLEQSCIARAEDPNLALWLIWSAKESAFKIEKKCNGAAIFRHRDFSVETENLFPREGQIQGKITVRERSFDLFWECTREYVHCSASDNGLAPSFQISPMTEFESSANSFTSAEEESIHSSESRGVRLLAKQILHNTFGWRKVEIIRSQELGQFSPPEVWREGKREEGLDISLSHDGRYLAAALSC